MNIQRVSIYSASPFGLQRDNMLHPPPAQWYIYSESNDTRYQKWEGSSVASGLRNLSNELDKKALLAQGRSVQNWVTNWIFKTLSFFKKIHSPTTPKSSGRLGGWEGVSWAGCCSYRGHQLLAHSGMAILGQEPLLVMYSETKLP